MINVAACNRTDLSDWKLEFDEYVPLALKRDDGLGGIRIRIGNLKTSLIELKVDPETRVLKSVTLVNFVREHFESNVKSISTRECAAALTGDYIDCLQGPPWALRYDVECEFSARFGSNSIEIDFGELDTADTLVVDGPLGLASASGNLVGILIFDVSSSASSFVQSKRNCTDDNEAL